MAATVNTVPPRNERTMWEWLPVGVAAIVSLLAAIFPVRRMFFKLQIDYNEGWNIYNAVKVSHHVALYGQKYSRTPVIYPPLSFYILSWLHGFGFDYLLAGRILSFVSLLASCSLIGVIVWRISRDRRAAAFASFFCLAVFCIAAAHYVGMDDPQMFAQVFFLGGLLLYISGPADWWRLGATSLIFIVGGNIKHSLIDFPLAVLVDLCFVSRRKVAEYVAISGLLLAVSIYLTILLAGPYYISNLLLPRPYSLKNAFEKFFLEGFAPLQIPAVIAALWSVHAFRNRTLRTCAIFFWCSLFVGLLLGGGRGEDVNVYFDFFLSLSLMMGLFLNWLWKGGAINLGLKGKWAPAMKVGMPLIVLLSLAPTWFAQPHLAGIRALPLRQKRFLEEVAFLRSRPGPDICENLLACYEAGKALELNPDSSLMLIRAGKLSERPIIRELQTNAFGAIEVDHPISWYLQGQGRFSVQFAAATAAHYKLAFTEPDCYIYVPATSVP